VPVLGHDHLDLAAVLLDQALPNIVASIEAVTQCPETSMPPFASSSMRTKDKNGSSVKSLGSTPMRACF